MKCLLILRVMLIQSYRRYFAQAKYTATMKIISTQQFSTNTYLDVLLSCFQMGVKSFKI